MRPVRILLGDLPAALYRAVSEAIHSQADIEVVGVAIQPMELLLAAGTLRADVLLVGMVDDELPGVASHALDQYPGIRVLAVAPDGRQALLCSLHPQIERVQLSSMAELVRTIQASGQPGAG